jgi:lysophospholipase L1-like esterase
LDDAPQRRLAELSRRLGFAYLDLLPLFRDKRPAAMFFDHCHPNPAANAWIGKAIAEKILREKLLRAAA